MTKPIIALICNYSPNCNHKCEKCPHLLKLQIIDSLADFKNAVQERYQPFKQTDLYKTIQVIALAQPMMEDIRRDYT